MNTETTDWTNKTKGETYKIWNKNLIIEDVHGTQDEISSIYHTPASSTSKSIDEKRVQETANEWKKTSENKEFLINKNKLTSQPIESEYLPDLDKEIRSEEHTSELQSHSFISYAVFCLKKKKKKKKTKN